MYSFSVILQGATALKWQWRELPPLLCWTELAIDCPLSSLASSAMIAASHNALWKWPGLLQATLVIWWVTEAHTHLVQVLILNYIFIYYIFVWVTTIIIKNELYLLYLDKGAPRFHLGDHDKPLNLNRAVTRDQTNDDSTQKLPIAECRAAGLDGATASIFTW